MLTTQPSIGMTLSGACPFSLVSWNGYKFTGKERDAESGLDDFGARYYASSLGRFMQADEPFADQNASDPQSWNVYVNVRNNPLRFSDPTGTTCVTDANGANAHDDRNGGQTCAEIAAENENAKASAEVTATAPPTPSQLARADGIIPGGLGPLDLVLGSQVRLPGYVG